MWQQFDPRHKNAWFWGIALNIIQLGGGDPVVLFRPPIADPPGSNPQGTERAQENEGPLPAEVNRNPGRGGRSNNGANIRPGVEDTSGQRSFLLGEPLGHGFDSCREIG